MSDLDTSINGKGLNISETAVRYSTIGQRSRENTAKGLDICTFLSICKISPAPFILTGKEIRQNIANVNQLTHHGFNLATTRICNENFMLDPPRP